MLKIKKLLSVLLVVVIIASFGVITASAESVKVTASTATPTLNSEFSVTVTFSGSGLGSIDATIKFDSNRLQIVNVPSGANNSGTGEILISHFGSEAFTSKAFDFKFKAIAEGDAKISVASSEVWTFDTSTKYTPSGSTTVKVVDKSKLSGNANLKSMILSNDIPLNPAFNKDITTYNVTVENSVEKVLINAAAEEKGANVAYGGSTKMKVGDNQRWVTVTAPNGTQKKYTINIKRLAPDEVISDPNTPTVNPYEVKIGEQTWVLVSEYTDEIKLGGFTVASAMINEFELPVLKSETTGEIVVFARLVGEEGKTAYFTFNSLTGEFKEYRLYNAAAGTIVLLPFESNLVLPNGYYKANATVGAYNIEVIKYNDAVFADFVIVYAQSSLGNKEYYRIDLKDNSVQRLPDFASKLEKAQSMANGTVITRFIALSNTEKIMICAIALAVVLLIVLIVILIIRLVRGIAYRQADEITDLDELEELEDFEEEEEIEEDEEDENF